MVIGVHHVQITIPTGEEAGARAFYCDFLGIPEIAKPATLAGRGGFWLRAGAFEVHVGTEPAFDRTQTKAHIAWLVEDLAAWRTRFANAGIETIPGIPLPGYVRVEFRDPFGNRAELIQAVAEGVA